MRVLTLRELSAGYGIVNLFKGVAVLVGVAGSTLLVEQTGYAMAPFLVNGCSLTIALVLTFVLRRILRRMGR